MPVVLILNYLYALSYSLIEYSPYILQRAREHAYSNIRNSLCRGNTYSTVAHLTISSLQRIATMMDRIRFLIAPSSHSNAQEVVIVMSYTSLPTGVHYNPTR